jgi:exopolysaccharide biosynthesis polyprenyl glycosylphosphotransferase
MSKMKSIRRRILVDALKLFDLGLMVFSFSLAALAAYRGSTFSLEQFLSMRIKVRNFVLFFGFLAAWHMVLRLFGLYKSWRLASRSAEIANLVKATSSGTLILVVLGVICNVKLITPGFLLVFWATVNGTSVISRAILRYSVEQVRVHGRNLRDILIVGTNSRAVEFARWIEAKPGLGCRIIGFADERWGGMQDLQGIGYPLVADLSGLPDFLRRNVVDEVVMALPLRSLYGCASQIANWCEEQGITLRFLPNIFNSKVARPRAEEFEGNYLITHAPGTVEGWPLVLKRIIDFTVSLALIVLLSPMFLIVAILIKLYSPGPVFFVQTRLGLNKRRFSIYKFRTMVPNAEQKMQELEVLNEVSGPVFKIKNDPRITPIGRLLRKTSIDELPQLFNVLRGEMSLVGPRPLPVRDYEGFDQDWQRRRFSVTPGITCLWQVNGRSSVDFDKWMELDMRYIDEWSLWLDLKILAQTIPAVLKGSGAA